MSTVIRELAARLALEAETFNNSLRQANRELKEFHKDIKPTKDFVKDLGVGMTATGGAVVASMLAMTKAAADYGDQINKASVQTGISTENLSKLKFAADQTESSFEAVSNGLKLLTKNAALAADGAKVQEKAFRELGVSVTDSSGKLRPMNDLLLDTADKFAAMEDGTEKAALAQQIFGKSGMEMIPILNLGRAGIEKMGDEAGRLGLVLSAEAAKAGDDFNDSMTAVNAAVLGLSNSVAQALLPALTATANFIRDSVATITAFAKEHETLTKIIFATAVAITGAGGLLLAVTAIGAASGPFWVGVAAVKAFGLSLSGLAVAGGPIMLTVAAVVGLGAALYKLKTAWDETQEAWKFARFAANETVGTYVKIEQAQEKVVKALTQEQQFAKRLAEERAADAKDLDKQYTLYKKNLDDAAEKAKKRAKEISDAHKTMTDVIAASNMRLRDQLERDMTAIVNSHTKAWDTINRIVKANVASNIRTEEDAAARATQLLAIQTDAWIIAQAKKAKTAEETVAAIDQINKDAGDALQKQVNDDAKKWQDVWANAMGNVVSNFARGVTDMIFEGKNFADSMKELFKDLAATIIQVLVTDAFTKVAKGLSGLISGGLGSLLGIGGSAAGGAASSAAGTAASAAGSVAGTAGSIAGSAVGGLASGLISGGLAAAGSIIGAMMGEGNARRTEENTRETRDWLELAVTSWNPVIHEQLSFTKEWFYPLVNDCKDLLSEIRTNIQDGFALVGGNAAPMTLVFHVDGRALATVQIPHILALSTNNAMQVVGTR